MTVFLTLNFIWFALDNCTSFWHFTLILFTYYRTTIYSQPFFNKLWVAAVRALFWFQVKKKSKNADWNSSEMANVEKVQRNSDSSGSQRPNRKYYKLENKNVHSACLLFL